jgi:hypothetical protein
MTPIFPKTLKNGALEVTEGGMTIRQWYIGQALVGILSGDNRYINDPAKAAERAASIASALVDIEDTGGGDA